MLKCERFWLVAYYTLSIVCRQITIFIHYYGAAFFQSFLETFFFNFWVFNTILSVRKKASLEKFNFCVIV